MFVGVHETLTLFRLDSAVLLLFSEMYTTCVDLLSRIKRSRISKLTWVRGIYVEPVETLSGFCSMKKPWLNSGRMASTKTLKPEL